MVKTDVNDPLIRSFLEIQYVHKNSREALK
jgi:hypothetical protein